MGDILRRAYTGLAGETESPERLFLCGVADGTQTFLDTTGESPNGLQLAYSALTTPMPEYLRGTVEVGRDPTSDARRVDEQIKHSEARQAEGASGVVTLGRTFAKPFS